MNAVLVAGATLVGLAAGGGLDPLGQRLAERSHRDEVRKREEAAEKRDAVPDDPATVPVPEPGPEPGPEPVPEPGHLVVQGPSAVRTVVAAVLTGALFGLAAVHFGTDLVLAPFCVLFALLVVVAMTDLSYRLVPRRLIYASLALVVPLLVATSAVDHQWQHLSGSAIAGAVAFGLFFTIWWFMPQGMGYGDVRLAGVIGICTGYLSLVHAYLAFFGGFVIGMVFGLIMMAVLASGRKTRIPFAPALSVGAVLAVFFGAHLAHSFFGTG
ncbi:MAG TPA: A24 family peptidase [Acidimicrobiales bacterium]|nr:A24 family peptidase [Acidimicrobiales bacterium]